LHKEACTATARAAEKSVQKKIAFVERRGNSYRYPPCPPGTGYSPYSIPHFFFRKRCNRSQVPPLSGFLKTAGKSAFRREPNAFRSASGSPEKSEKSLPPPLHIPIHDITRIPPQCVCSPCPLQPAPFVKRVHSPTAHNARISIIGAGGAVVKRKIASVRSGGGTPQGEGNRSRTLNLPAKRKGSGTGGELMLPPPSKKCLVRGNSANNPYFILKDISCRHVPLQKF